MSPVGRPVEASDENYAALPFYYDHACVATSPWELPLQKESKNRKEI